MEVLTALSLAATDPFWTNDCEVCDWPRAEAAAAAIALSDAPHCAVAVALNAINSTDRAASLTNVMLSIILTILLLPLLLAIFLFIPFLLRDEICDLVNQISPSSDQLVAVVVTCMLARPRLARMLREGPGHILQTSALINEAYLRLVDQPEIRWENRNHFFGIAARLMRRILVDDARKRNAAKRGGSLIQVPLDEATSLANEQSANVAALDAALKMLETIDARQGQIVELRFFGGLSIEETAEVLKVSPGTVMRDWTFAGAWLRNKMSGARSRSRLF